MQRRNPRVREASVSTCRARSARYGPHEFTMSEKEGRMGALAWVTLALL